MGKSKRQAGDGGERGTNKLWGTARDTRVKEESKRQGSDGEEREAGECWRTAKDRRVIQQSEKQASDGENEGGLWRSLRLPLFGAPSIFSASEMELDYTIICTYPRYSLRI